MPRLTPCVRTVASYLGAVAICVFVLSTIFDLPSGARTWPYAYRGETMVYQLLTKNVVDHGWFLDVPLLGAPGMLNLRDVPMSDNLHILMLRLLALGTAHYPTVLNNFFLLGFVLIFLCALVVFRHFGISWSTGVCASLLYTFAPFHFLRGEHHLFLSAYWPIPLAVLLALWVSGDGFRMDRDRRRVWNVRRLSLGVAISAVLSATGVYYAFFACFFLLVASIVAAVRDGRWRALLPGLGLIAIIGVGVVLNLMPSVLHFREHGPVPVVQRLPGDADTYGLRIAQLLLPVRGHRLWVLEALKTEYTRRPLINENDDVSLGAAGALGFLGLLWWLLFRKASAEGVLVGGAAGLLHRLSIFNVTGVLFGTIGGFGSLVAFFGLPQIRAYNRISVFLSFFALFALALWVDSLMRRHAATRLRAIGLGAVLAVLTALGLYEQISPKALPDSLTTQTQFTNDAAFVRRIEQNVPRGALIFQLPIQAFPEATPVARLRDYDLLRGYLHSSHLRWSYGTVSGREGHAWLRRTAALPADQLVETLAWAGFSGMTIHRGGFVDDGAEIEAELSALLHVAPLHSLDNEMVFFDLRSYRAHLEETTPRGDWEIKREAALHPPLAVWVEGFSDDEAPGGWRWGAATARMILVNRATHPQTVHLEMTVVPNPGGTVTIRSPLFAAPLRIEGGQPKVARAFRLPPGEHDLHFASDAPRIYPPDDFRNLVFSVREFRLTP